MTPRPCMHCKNRRSGVVEITTPICCTRMLPVLGNSTPSRNSTQSPTSSSPTLDSTMECRSTPSRYSSVCAWTCQLDGMNFSVSGKSSQPAARCTQTTRPRQSNPCDGTRPLCRNLTPRTLAASSRSRASYSARVVTSSPHHQPMRASACRSAVQPEG